MKRPNEDHDWPRRLQQEGHGLGALLRSYVRRLDANADETAAFVRARAAHHRRSLRNRVVLSGALTMAAGLGAWLLLAQFGKPGPAVQSSRHEEAVTAGATATGGENLRAAPPAPRNVLPTPVETQEVVRPAIATRATARRTMGRESRLPSQSVRLRTTPLDLAVGRTVIRQQATVVLGDNAKAVAWRRAKATGITLATGSLDLQVRPRAPGHTFVVHAAPYDFVVVGTVFRVVRTGERVNLGVSEGRVVVQRQGHALASIGRGQSWTGTTDDAVAPPPVRPVTPPAARMPLPVVAAVTPAVVAPAAPAVMPSLPPPVVAPAPVASPPAWSPCAALAEGPRPLARRQLRAAIDCYDRISDAGDGPDHEFAAYEAARLLGETGTDLEPARRAFRAYQARFPQGSLNVEAALALLEILPRLNRREEALAVATQLLTLPEASPRRSEIQLIHANLQREIQARQPAAVTAPEGKQQREDR